MIIGIVWDTVTTFIVFALGESQASYYVF